MLKLSGCLIEFLGWCVEILSGSKCGKAKFLDSSFSLNNRSFELLAAKAQSCAEIHYSSLAGNWAEYSDFAVS